MAANIQLVRFIGLKKYPEPRNKPVRKKSQILENFDIQKK